jgi:hypothetical protein
MPCKLLTTTFRSSLLATAVLLGVGCRSTEPEVAESIADGSVSAPALPDVSDSEDGSATALEHDVAAEASAAAVPEVAAEASGFVAPEHTAAERTFTLGITATSQRVGVVQWEFPDGSVEAPVEVVARVHARPEDSPRAMPAGIVLLSFSAEPWNPPLQQNVVVRMPVPEGVPPGTTLELLGWQPSMRAYMVIATGLREAETGLVSFGVRQMGDFILRAQPVQRREFAGRCPDRRIPLGHSWPGSPEDETVGLVEVEDRLPRELAFNVLTDFRLLRSDAAVEFKNEEVRDTGATRSDDRDHQDEDYIMDPGAAAAVNRLGDMVALEWIDPLSGEPSYRVRVTEAYDSLIEHSQRSTHYHGRAIDLTLSPVPAPSEAERRLFYGRLSSMSVCAGFDYVLFENQYHVHASVLPTRLLVTDTSGASRSARLVRPDVWYAEEGSGIRVSETAQDGMRRLTVGSSGIWLSNGTRVAPLGSADADGVPVDLQYPVAIDAQVPAQSAGFIRRGRAWQGWFDAP